MLNMGTLTSVKSSSNKKLPETQFCPVFCNLHAVQILCIYCRLQQEVQSDVLSCLQVTLAYVNVDTLLPLISVNEVLALLTRSSTTVQKVIKLATLQYLTG